MTNRDEHYMQVFYYTKKTNEFEDPKKLLIHFSYDDLAQIVEDLEKIREDPPQEIIDPLYENWTNSFYYDSVFFRVRIERIKKDDGKFDCKAGFEYEVEIRYDVTDTQTLPVTTQRIYTSEELRQKPLPAKRKR